MAVNSKLPDNHMMYLALMIPWFRISGRLQAIQPCPACRVHLNLKVDVGIEQLQEDKGD